MAKLSDKDILKIASLAKLTLTPKEVKKFSAQLSKVISYVDELSSINTNNISPTSQTTGLTNISRKDEVDISGGLSQEEALSGTDNTHNGYFVVNRLLAERSER